MFAQFSDVEQILIVVVVLYILELIVWARGNSFVISSQFGKYRLRTERSVLSNDRGRLYFSGFFPWDATFIVQPIPISMDLQAFSNIVIAAPGWNERPVQVPQGLNYEDVARLRVDNYHLMDGERTFCSLASPMTAKRLLTRLQSIARADGNNKRAIIAEHVSNQFSVSAVLERIELWRRATMVLSVLGTLLALWIFGVGTGLALQWIPMPEDPMTTLIAYLVVMFGLWWTCALMSYRAHKQLYPSLGAERAMQTFVAFVSPVAAMRGRDHMARHLFEGVHPLPVLYALGAPQINLFAAAAARDAAHPLPLAPEFADDLSEQAFEAIGDYHRTYQQSLDACIRAIGMTPEELLFVPKPTDSEAQSYCERCLHEFDAGVAHCQSCGGRAAQQFSVST